MHPGPTAVLVAKPERAEKEPYGAPDKVDTGQTGHPSPEQPGQGSRGDLWKTLASAPHWTETMKKPSVRVVAESTRKTSPAQAIAEDS